jgi:hypothetical protein
MLLGLTIGEAIILLTVAASFAIQLVALVFIARDVRYVGDIQRAILLRTDRTEKAVADIKAAVEK